MVTIGYRLGIHGILREPIHCEGENVANTNDQPKIVWL